MKWWSLIYFQGHIPWSLLTQTHLSSCHHWRYSCVTLLCLWPQSWTYCRESLLWGQLDPHWGLPCPCWVTCRCMRSLPHHKLGKETQEHCFGSFLDLHSGWRSLWPHSLPWRPLQGYRWNQDVHMFLLLIAPVHSFRTLLSPAVLKFTPNESLRATRLWILESCPVFLCLFSFFLPTQRAPSCQ